MLIMTQRQNQLINFSHFKEINLVNIEGELCMALDDWLIGSFKTESDAQKVLADLFEAYGRDEKIFRIPPASQVKSSDG